MFYLSFPEIVAQATVYRYECVSKKARVGPRQYFSGQRALTLGKNELGSTKYLLPLASKTSFTEWHAKLSRAPTLICLPCCAILACRKVGT